MLLRSDVENVLEALLEKEFTYWVDHKEEWLRRSRDPGDLWDGYHWHYVRCLLQAQMWWDLVYHLDRLTDTHLKDQVLHLIKVHSPRLSKLLCELCEKRIKG